MAEKSSKTDGRHQPNSSKNQVKKPYKENHTEALLKQLKIQNKNSIIKVVEKI